MKMVCFEEGRNKNTTQSLYASKAAYSIICTTLHPHNHSMKHTYLTLLLQMNGLYFKGVKCLALDHTMCKQWTWDLIILPGFFTPVLNDDLPPILV